MTERVAHRALIIIALLGLAAGIVAYLAGHVALAHQVWATATLPVIMALAVSIARDLLQGRMGVDAIAFLSMIVALILGQSLAGSWSQSCMRAGRRLRTSPWRVRSGVSNRWWIALRGQRIAASTKPSKMSLLMRSRSAMRLSSALGRSFRLMAWLFLPVP